MSPVVNMNQINVMPINDIAVDNTAEIKRVERYISTQKRIMEGVSNFSDNSAVQSSQTQLFFSCEQLLGILESRLQKLKSN